DLAVRGGDDEDRERGQKRKKNREILVLAEVLEGLFRAVRRGGEAVGAEADPGEEGRQRQRVEEVRVLDVLRLAKEEAPDLAEAALRRLWRPRFRALIDARGHRRTVLYQERRSSACRTSRASARAKRRQSLIALATS